MAAREAGAELETRVVRQKASATVNEAGARVHPRKGKVTTMDLKASATPKIDGRGVRAGAGVAVASDIRPGVRSRTTTSAATIIDLVIVTSASLIEGDLSGNGQPPISIVADLAAGRVAIEALVRLPAILQTDAPISKRCGLS